MKVKMSVTYLNGKTITGDLREFSKEQILEECEEFLDDKDVVMFSCAIERK